MACGEYREKWEQSEIHVKTLKQHKKSLELVGTLTHSNFVRELHDCWLASVMVTMIALVIIVNVFREL